MATDAQVFDRAQKRWGIGNHDPDSGVPWYRYRAGEIGKLKRIRQSRNVDPSELVLAIDYSLAMGMNVRSIFDLFDRISDAAAWARERDAVDATRGLEARIQEAITLEREADPNSPWIDRLIRAAGPAAREEVYREWETSSRSSGSARV